MQKEKELILKGVPISRGIAIGKAFFFSIKEDEITEIEISKNDIDKEIKRYRIALQLSRLNLEKLKKAFSSEGRSIVVEILEAHLQMLYDPFITEVVEQRIINLKKNSEAVFKLVIEEYKKVIEDKKEPFFQERVKDIIDVSHRIMQNLSPIKQLEIAQVPANSIILARDLIPSNTAEARSDKIKAFVTQLGGKSSHCAIIARAKKIPYVANISTNFLKKKKIHSLIVDGNEGRVVINPNKSTLEAYKQLKALSQKKQISFSHVLSKTKDDKKINVYANIESKDDIDLVINSKAKGIGLFRSEFLIFKEKQIPSQDFQYEYYSQMIKQLKDRNFVIRLFDIGADKNLIFSSCDIDDSFFAHELNPMLGCRGIRFLLKNKKILEDQITAIIRASCFGNIKILIPLVCDLFEIIEVKKMIKSIGEDLKIDVSKIQIGTMIEVPSIAIMIKSIIPHIDFLSIGTNDLTQYILAVDRSNSDMEYLYCQYHPAILQMIKNIVDVAKRNSTKLTICGEMVNNREFIKLLLGLGIENFSLAPNNIISFKKLLNEMDYKKSKDLAAKAIEADSIEKIKILFKN
jgi:phosphoenolpyruvate-protein phosphotransferase (PTS system enzyme I)